VKVIITNYQLVLFAWSLSRGSDVLSANKRVLMVSFICPKMSKSSARLKCKKVITTLIISKYQQMTNSLLKIPADAESTLGREWVNDPVPDHKSRSRLLWHF
jgi:hypothetical protein